ncbi:MAG TPA: heavy metal translocating P-type ATPase [Casimicrobiaceae bacterium]
MRSDVHVSHDRSVTTCFHCGQLNPPTSHWYAVSDGVERRFCCAGCLGIAQAIRAAGLDQFYRRRDASGGRPPKVAGDDEATRQGDAAEAAGLVVQLDRDLRETALLLEGIHCAACVWLIETYLRRHPGVVAVSVNFATRRARVQWNSRQTQLSALLRAVVAIGYRAYPYDPARREALVRREGRALLARTALALLAMMQVMMFAVPGYISVDGIEPKYRTLLDWASLVLTLPVVLYSASPFLVGALRDLRLRRLGMDVPVTLGVAVAFVASAWATVTGSGAVYYDSVTMFVALLLVARWVELRARVRAGDAIESIAHDLPETAERLTDYPRTTRAETAPASRLRSGDWIRIAAGAPIPADGDVVEGRSHVEEAVLTGESWPQAKAPGSTVLAGSINRESPLIVRVTAAGAETALAALGRLVERAGNERPRVARLADRVAAWFVAALLGIAAATGLVWWQLEPARALAVTLAVLVVSCPCALSLATPAALAAAVGALGRRCILAVRSDALETLSRVTHVVLDKTGTLTTGRVQLIRVEPLAGYGRAACVALAAALEQGSEHPIARALRAAAAGEVDARDVAATPGSGVEGTINGRRYRLGRSEWVAGLHGQALPATAVAADAIAVALGNESGWLASFSFGDTLRPGARSLVADLRGMGIVVSLLSGDRIATVRHVAQAVGIDEYCGDARPEDKRTLIAELQDKGAVVAMVGDGINDAPSLAQANVSLALGSAATLAQWTADVVVLGDDLPRIGEAIARARWTFRVIRQNLAWAFVYNLIAIPLAATGYLTPLAAALGMSASSLLVVANALRLLRGRRALDAAATVNASPLAAAS